MTTTVHDLVAAWVAEQPDHPAVSDHHGRCLSYRELWSAAGRLACELADCGVAPGDPVAIAADRSLEMVTAMVGVLRRGAYYVLLDPYSPPARNEMMLTEMGAKVLVEASGETSDQPDWSIQGVPHRIVLPLPGGEDKVPYRRRDAEDTVYVAYTSGSTGAPKGAVAPERAVVNFVTETDLMPLTPADRVASLCNPASDATTMEIWKPLCAGATIVVLPPVVELDVPDWPEVLREQGITAMFMMAGLVDLIAREDPKALESLDLLIFGGEALNPDTARRICAGKPPRRLVLGYGPTEVTVFATYYEVTKESIGEGDRIPLGRPLRDYVLTIVDEQLHPVAAGEPGELCVGGPGVAKGYLARPELTANRFVELDAGLSYRTGDVVRELPGGALEFVARVDRQVKIRGFRIELEEVERGVLATGLVRTAVVAKVDGERAHLVCFFVSMDETATAITLSAALTRKLPGYMIPSRWVKVEDVPYTSIGKIDRAGLVAGLSGGE